MLYYYLIPIWLYAPRWIWSLCNENWRWRMAQRGKSTQQTKKIRNEYKWGTNEKKFLSLTWISLKSHIRLRNKFKIKSIYHFHQFLHVQQICFPIYFNASLPNYTCSVLRCSYHSPIPPHTQYNEQSFKVFQYSECLQVVLT